MVTYTLIAICVIIYAAEWIPKLDVAGVLLYAPVTTETQPWRMLTSVFVHSQDFIPHLFLNMYALYVLGRALEPVFGRLRFLTIFLVSGLAGSVAVLLLAAPGQAVVGASGAIFGLFGALFVLQLKRRSDIRQVVILLVINGAIAFLPGAQIAWQAHVGGLIGGALVTAGMIYAKPGASQKLLQAASVIGVLVLLLALTLWKIPALHAISLQYVF
ncbi:rhomboid family intramembrane serine protease [Psychromicrobium xiongbiense]|uniref:rhomboid family intramembrane serine protease n=1 Tax=Psychromicrobium xiongbiense TaxID=3051184 RepID=UPI003075B491